MSVLALETMRLADLLDWDESKKAATGNENIATPSFTGDGKMSYKCEECEKVFSHFILLEMHGDLCLKQNRKERNDSFKNPSKMDSDCLTTNDGKQVLTYLHQHTNGGRLYVRQLSCEQCGLQLRTQKEEECHICMNTGSDCFDIKCTQCVMYFSSSEDLMLHRSRNHYKAFSYTCEECGQRFADKFNEEKHLQMHAKDNGQIYDENSTGFVTATRDASKCNYIGNYPLNKCNNESPSENGISNEAKLKHSFICFNGGNSYESNQSRKIHMQIHVVERPFKCNECSAAFRTVPGVKYHIRAHTGERPYNCNECCAAFTVKHVLKMHMYAHTGERPFKCNECSAAFRTVLGLKNHIRVHIGECPYKCNKCSAAFTIKQVLQTHLHVHTGERPFKCNKCGAAFIQSCALKMHMRIHTRKSPSACDELNCNYTCKSSSNLKNHKRSKHHRQKPFVCRQPSRPFLHRGVVRKCSIYLTKREGVKNPAKNFLQCMTTAAVNDVSQRVVQHQECTDNNNEICKAINKHIQAERPYKYEQCTSTLSVNMNVRNQLPDSDSTLVNESVQENVQSTTEPSALDNTRSEIMTTNQLTRTTENCATLRQTKLNDQIIINSPLQSSDWKNIKSQAPHVHLTSKSRKPCSTSVKQTDHQNVASIAELIHLNDIGLQRNPVSQISTTNSSTESRISLEKETDQQNSKSVTELTDTENVNALITQIKPSAEGGRSHTTCLIQEITNENTLSVAELIHLYDIKQETQENLPFPRRERSPGKIKQKIEQQRINFDVDLTDLNSNNFLASQANATLASSVSSTNLGEHCNQQTVHSLLKGGDLDNINSESSLSNSAPTNTKRNAGYKKRIHGRNLHDVEVNDFNNDNLKIIPTGQILQTAEPTHADILGIKNGVKFATRNKNRTSRAMEEHVPCIIDKQTTAVKPLCLSDSSATLVQEVNLRVVKIILERVDTTAEFRRWTIKTTTDNTWKENSHNVITTSSTQPSSNVKTIFGRKKGKKSSESGKAFMCEEPNCDYMCTRKIVDDHRHSKLIGEKPFICGECGLSCYSQTSLYIHKLKHTRNHLFVCDQPNCSYTCPAR